MFGHELAVLQQVPCRSCKKIPIQESASLENCGTPPKVNMDCRLYCQHFG